MWTNLKIVFQVSRFIYETSHIYSNNSSYIPWSTIFCNIYLGEWSMNHHVSLLVKIIKIENFINKRWLCKGDEGENPDNHIT